MMTMTMMMMLDFWIHKLKQMALNQITNLLKETESTYTLLHVTLWHLWVLWNKHKSP